MVFVCVSFAFYLFIIIILVCLLFYVLICLLERERRCGVGWVERIWEKIGKKTDQNKENEGVVKFNMIAKINV